MCLVVAVSVHNVPPKLGEAVDLSIKQDSFPLLSKDLVTREVRQDSNERDVRRVRPDWPNRNSCSA